jgi:glyoxylase-like metal-dependent hydrolase (beta-lactamase superfamily II)
MREIAPGLRYWKAPHPEWNGATEWPEDVGCVYYEAADALALIDPLLPRGREEAFLAALDREVARLDRPVVVLLTAPWHKRDAASIAERYGTTVWAQPAAQARIPFETQAGPLPDGIETFSAGGVWEGDVAFYIGPQRALVVAEFFMGVDGALRVCLSPALQDRAAFETSLYTLIEWPIDHVLVSHGEPVIGNGRQRIREALRAFAETR